MTDFLKTFDLKYFNLLNPRMNWQKAGTSENLCQRGNGFRTIFQKLIEKNKNSYQIIETGVLRNPGHWKDGQSSFLFQEFCKMHNGILKSVDIDIETCNIAKTFLDINIVNISCDDSINFLRNQNLDTVDLIYLDSYDVKWSDHISSAEHHLKEFLTIEDKIKTGTIVVIDDNTYYQKKRAGKGTLIFEYLQSKGKLPEIDDYQIIYQF
jgi:hypothetical protein